MTYGMLKNVATGLLLGDKVLTNNDEVLISLLAMAFNEIAMHANSLHLMTLNRAGETARLAQGDYVIRTPQLPTVDTDELDIDNELGFVAARFIASYISQNNKEYHMHNAKIMIKDYNEKVAELLESFTIDEEGCYNDL